MGPVAGSSCKNTQALFRESNKRLGIKTARNNRKQQKQSSSVSLAKSTQLVLGDAGSGSTSTTPVMDTVELSPPPKETGKAPALKVPMSEVLSKAKEKQRARRIANERERQKEMLEKMEEEARLNVVDNFEVGRELKRLIGPCCGLSLSQFGLRLIPTADCF